jgi:hypothetical protein
MNDFNNLINLDNDIEKKIRGSLSRFYLKTLLGFSLSKKECQIYENNKTKNLFLILSPFIFPILHFDENEIENLLNIFGKHFFVLPNNIVNTESYLEKGFKLQKRTHFLNHDREFCNKFEKSHNVAEINEKQYEKIRSHTQFPNHLQNYVSFAEFEKFGCGSYVYENDEIVSVASAFCYFNNEVEIQVDTLNNKRKCGYATQSAQYLIKCAYRKGLVPRWDAATEISLILGRKLGFIDERTYYMLYKHELG